MRGSKRDTEVKNRLLDSVGEGKGGMIWEWHWNMYIQFSSVQSLSHVWLFATHESQQTRPPCPSPAPRVYPNSCPSSWWCHPAISSSIVPFSSCPQSLTASGSFPMSQLFAWGGQSIGVSALASVLPKKSQDWSPLEWNGWISLQSKGHMLASAKWKKVALSYVDN